MMQELMIVLLKYGRKTRLSIEKLSLKNYEAEYRVVLIWMPERMNLEASNKLLKLFAMKFEVLRVKIELKKNISFHKSEN